MCVLLANYSSFKSGKINYFINKVLLDRKKLYMLDEKFPYVIIR
jgi:hypothetical protein